MLILRLIPQYAEEKYGLESNATNNSHLNRAIATGVEQEIFSLPKSWSGKVKLYRPPAATKEVF